MRPDVAAAIDALRARGYRVMPAGTGQHQVSLRDRRWTLNGRQLLAFLAALPAERRRRAPAAATRRVCDDRQLSLLPGPGP